ncbi:bifunctional riboflavin kinase/FAD synthetase [Buchnera aphidicola (Aphis helianthi)]|uniref:Riboflavin biosynthesis protein n=1 Tax=Buchnera aphidicola (Aphis helianthi) TaxID=2315802 RepID=A0A4D6XPK5_9GAMM|nr:bifunctional riboflavin kinase/FAD synthetase [Buchnera aphidicola]QCI16984.1 bifunctional riboflavin kinase/FAD synthetase [Buchnera aphidicola (Aphis helianthi)]
MRIIRGIHNLKKINSNSVVSIGNFDGVHLGHQKLLSNVYNIGKEKNLPTIIILFEPQPLEFFNHQNPPKRITKFREKIKYIQLYKIDIVLCIQFNIFFSNLSAEKFIIQILINKLNIKFIIIGKDFKFGSKRNGNISLLQEISKKYKFNIIEIKPLYKDNIKVSSTNIRKYLLENNFKLVQALLGRPFSLIGRVIYGNQIGKTLGYPTANIKLYDNFPLNNGVYAVQVHFKKIYLGICNIGIKPSYIYIPKIKILEAHLFNTNINLYNKKIEVFLYKKIRNELFFSSTQKLKDQISKDIKIVTKYFNTFNYGPKK